MQKEQYLTIALLFKSTIYKNIYILKKRSFFKFRNYYDFYSLQKYTKYFNPPNFFSTKHLIFNTNKNRLFFLCSIKLFYNILCVFFHTILIVHIVYFNILFSPAPRLPNRASFHRQLQASPRCALFANHDNRLPLG